jgi:hypothetical protein
MRMAVGSTQYKAKLPLNKHTYVEANIGALLMPLDDESG